MFRKTQWYLLCITGAIGLITAACSPSAPTKTAVELEQAANATLTAFFATIVPSPSAMPVEVTVAVPVTVIVTVEVPITVVVTATPAEATATPDPATANSTIAASAPTAAPATAAPIGAGTRVASGLIEVNTAVRVVNTDGKGIRLRIEPGFSSETASYGTEGEIFLIDAGPDLVDGANWWKVTTEDGSRAGWTVESYLQRIP
jgi:hypothetical protein